MANPSRAGFIFSTSISPRAFPSRTLTVKWWSCVNPRPTRNADVKMTGKSKRLHFSKAPMQNRFHIYYGYGKGKTTAALGLILRAVGAGQKSALVQFDKGYDGQNEHYSERKILRSFPNLSLYPFGKERVLGAGAFRFRNELGDEEEAHAALAKAMELTERGDQFLLVLDEILAAVMCKLLSTDQALQKIQMLDKRYMTRALTLIGYGDFALIAAPELKRSLWPDDGFSPLPQFLGLSRILLDLRQSVPSARLIPDLKSKAKKFLVKIVNRFIDIAVVDTTPFRSPNSLENLCAVNAIGSCAVDAVDCL